jgi:ankyrin repeat protein
MWRGAGALLTFGARHLSNDVTARSRLNLTAKPAALPVPAAKPPVPTPASPRPAPPHASAVGCRRLARNRAGRALGGLLFLAVSLWPAAAAVAPAPSGAARPRVLSNEESRWRAAALQGDKPAMENILRRPDTLAKLSAEVLAYLLAQKELAGFRRALAAGANPNVMIAPSRIPSASAQRGPASPTNDPLLTLCCLTDDTGFLDAMLDHGANTEITDQNKRTPLHRAVMENRPQAVARLVRRGANLQAKDANGDTPMMIAQRLAPIAELLRKAAAGETLPVPAEGDELTLERPDPKKTVFVGAAAREAADAIFRHDLFGLRQALAQGLDANTADTEGGTLLRLALATENLAIFKELLARQADPGKAFVTHLAAMAPAPDYLREIIASGADLNLRAPGQLTPLLLAIIKGRLPQAALLIGEKSVNLNAQDSQGNTALMHALLGRHQEIENLLVLRGADTALKNHRGLTAFDLAAGDARLEMRGTETPRTPPSGGR